MFQSLSTVLLLARRILTLAYWFAMATLVAGLLLLVQIVDWDNIIEPIVAGVVFLGPGLLLVHFVGTLRAASRSAFRPSASSRPGMAYGIAGALTLLTRPWYWGAVGLAVLVGAALLPIAAVVTLANLF